MKKLLTACIWCIATLAYAQPGYDDQHPAEFLNSGVANAEFDLRNPDYQLLNATIFHTINYLRLQKGYTMLKFSPELYAATDSFLQHNRTSRFVITETNRNRFAKQLKPMVKKCRFNGGLTDFMIAAPYALKYRKGKAFYINRKDTETSYHLFYGDSKDKNNPRIRKRPVPPYTYQDYANTLIRYWMRNGGSRILMNKAYEYMACQVRVDALTLDKNKIPLSKVMILVGGSYINFDN